MPARYCALIAACLVATAVAVPAAATPRAPSAGKQQAPADVAIAVGRSSAEVTVTFRSAADAVQVALSGVNGLAIDPQGAVLDDATVAAGDVRTFTVRFTSRPAQGDLAVFVRGRFNGLMRNKVVSQRIAPAAMMAKRRPAPPNGPEGRPEVILPATRR